MQAWIVKHKDGTRYAYESDDEIGNQPFPYLFAKKTHADGVADWLGDDNWQVVEVEITEK